VIRKAIVAAYLAGLTVGSLLPKDAADALGGTNPVLHIVAYFGLTALIFWAGPRSGRALPVGAAFSVVWGALLEAAQLWVPGRAPGWDDVAANAAGAVLAALVCSRFCVKGSASNPDGKSADERS